MNEGRGPRSNCVYRRSGHLFPNRFKSTLVERESYLLELVRYIVIVAAHRVSAQGKPSSSLG
jgi:hypothetical protein